MQWVTPPAVAATPAGWSDSSCTDLCQRVPSLRRSWLNCSRWTERLNSQTCPFPTWSARCSLKIDSAGHAGPTSQANLNARGRDAGPRHLRWIRSRASSLDRVMFCSRQDEGRRDWLCLTKRCEQRTCNAKPQKWRWGPRRAGDKITVRLQRGGFTADRAPPHPIPQVHHNGGRDGSLNLSP